MRLAGLVKGGYYPTPLRCIDLAAQLLQVQSQRRFPARENLRLIDPCCGPGDAVAQLAGHLSLQTNAELQTFGVELETERAGQARQQLDCTLQVDLFQTMLAHNSFHLLFLNPPYDYDQEAKRVEHAFLTRCTPFLADQGLLLFVVPKHRLAVSARYLAAHYRQLQCRRFPDPEYEDFDQVILFGKRQLQPQASDYQEEQIRRWAQVPPAELKTLDDPQPPPRLAVPTGEPGPVLFTLRTVDPARAAAEAQQSGLWRHRAIREKLWPEAPTPCQPLLPLRQGHMAMLVAAGFLDNLALEHPRIPGRRILVKGRTVKKRELVEHTETEEVWQERMHTTIRTLDLTTGAIRNVATQRPEPEDETG